MIQQSPTPTLNAALAKFHSEMGPIPKNRTAKIPMKSGGSYSYKYADFADLVEAGRAGLQSNGLAITQGAKYLGPNEWAYVTTLLHSSGEERSFEYPLKRPDLDPKADGSWFTYYRRYGASAILGLSMDEDDDGTGATKGTKTKTESDEKTMSKPAASKPPTAPASSSAAAPSGVKTPAAGAPAKVTQAQIKRLFAIMSEKDWSKEQVELVLSSRKVAAIDELTKPTYDRLIELIQAKNFDTWYASTAQPGDPAN